MAETSKELNRTTKTVVDYYRQRLQHLLENWDNYDDPKIAIENILAGDGRTHGIRKAETVKN